MLEGAQGREKKTSEGELRGNMRTVYVLVRPRRTTHFLAQMSSCHFGELYDWKCPDGRRPQGGRDLEIQYIVNSIHCKFRHTLFLVEHPRCLAIWGLASIHEQCRESQSEVKNSWGSLQPSLGNPAGYVISRSVMLYFLVISSLEFFSTERSAFTENGSATTVGMCDSDG